MPRSATSGPEADRTDLRNDDQPREGRMRRLAKPPRRRRRDRRGVRIVLAVMIAFFGWFARFYAISSRDFTAVFAR